MRDRANINTNLPPAYDGSMDIDLWKSLRAKELKAAKAKQSSLLRLRDSSGKSLYAINESGNHRRTKPMSRSRRREVVERDNHSCVWCGSAGPFEVDHITRYADGGSNEADNLQTLCEPCHRSKGGK